jgi:hypothetical protein
VEAVQERLCVVEVERELLSDPVGEAEPGERVLEKKDIVWENVAEFERVAEAEREMLHVLVGCSSDGDVVCEGLAWVNVADDVSVADTLPVDVLVKDSIELETEDDVDGTLREAVVE